MNSLNQAVGIGDPTVFGPGTPVVFVRPYHNGNHHIQAGVTGTVECAFPHFQIHIDDPFYVASPNRLVQLEAIDADEHLAALTAPPARTQLVAFDAVKL